MNYATIKLLGSDVCVGYETFRQICPPNSVYQIEYEVNSVLTQLKRLAAQQLQNTVEYIYYHIANNYHDLVGNQRKWVIMLFIYGSVTGS